MAPRRSGKVRDQGLQVADNNLAGAHADGGHHHLNTKTQSIVPPVDIAEANTTANLKRTAIDLRDGFPPKRTPFCLYLLLNN